MTFYKKNLSNKWTGKKDLCLSLLSGGLIVLSMPKLELSFVAWISLVPLFVAMDGRSPLDRFWQGLLCGLVTFSGSMYWLVYAMQTYGNLPWPMALLLFFLLTASLALYVALFGWITGIVKTKLLINEWILAPLIWCALEYVRNFFLSGFPWVLIGYSQYRFLHIIQIADITGIYGVSFLVLLVNTGLFEIMKIITSPNRKKEGLLYPILVLLVVLTSALYGIWRIEQIKSLSREAQTLRVGIAQGNIAQEIKWNPEFQEKTFDIYRDLTLRIAEKRPDLVIWPETAAPFYFPSNRKYSQRLLNVVRDAGVELLFGSPAYKRKGKEIELFNRAYLISGGEIVGQYDKIHLVPFGEYVPLRRFLPFAKRMVVSVGDFSPGKETIPLWLKKEIPFGVLICFESIFPELSRGFVKRGARFIVNITNDAWYGYSSAPYQHLSMLTLRAVENRVSIARAANTGISAVIDPTGRIQARTDLFKRQILIDKISILPIKSFYTRYGDLFSYLCFGITILLLFSSLSRARFMRTLKTHIRKDSKIGRVFFKNDN